MNGLVEFALALAAVGGWRLSTHPRQAPGYGPTGTGGIARRVFRPGGRRGPPGAGGLRGTPRAADADAARWATRRDVRALVVEEPTSGRVTLGTARGRVLAAERGHSVLVVGPTQSRKTSGFAVPAILEWEGPVVAALVKSDLARHTLEWRRRQGHAW